MIYSGDNAALPRALTWLLLRNLGEGYLLQKTIFNALTIALLLSQ